MSEENPIIEDSKEEELHISNETYEYMLSQLSKEEMISIILKSFKPGNAFYDDFMEMAATDKRFFKIFVFDMSFNVTEDDLLTSFSKFGKVNEVRILLNESKKSKGCGFIKFESPLSALKAFENDVIIDGRPVQMKLSEMGENAPRFRKTSTKEKDVDDQGPKDSRKIHVNGFPLEWKNDDIENFFKEFGELEEAFVCFEKGSVRSRGFGFVTFVNKKDYEKCLANPVIERDGCRITCSKVSKTSEGRPRRMHYDDRDMYRGEKRDRYDDRHDDRYYGYNTKERDVHDYPGAYDKRGQDPYYQDSRRYDSYNYPPSDYKMNQQPYYSNYPPSQPYQGNDYMHQQSYPSYNYSSQPPSSTPPNSSQPPSSYDPYGYPPSNY